ncbi:MAG: ABC transporter permease [Spirochaetaceae bacterium]|nr:ABC transporter permease [Spirochaetaceae bacterium]
MLKTFATILGTEIRLSLRNPDMIVFGVIFPVGVMLLLGFISSPEATRLDFGGIVAFGICAAGLMGLPLTLADYRHRKVLKRLRVTPASPALLLGAQAICQCLFVAISSTAVFLIARLGFGVEIAGTPARFLLSFLLVQASIFGLGFLVGSLAPNAKVANAVTSLLYFPMIFLSGATIPFEILPRALRVASEVLPLTQGIKLLKGAVLGSPPEASLVPIVVLSVIAIASYSVSVKYFRWE